MPDWVADLAASAWLPLVLFALVVGDAFLVVLPSETLVVAAGALAAATGSPSLAVIIPVAALGAVVGDGCCYAIGRRLGLERWRWQREGRIAAALDRVRSVILSRPAVLIFTARYIPFARIAVNLSAGAARLPLRRFLPLSAAAGTAWALYNTGVGAVFGASLPGQPLLAVLLSVVVAVALGVAVDAITQRLARRRAAGDGTP